MPRLLAWFRSHPLTTICLALIGCAVGTHLLANWRAEVRWQRYCTAARARGVKLTPAAESSAAGPNLAGLLNASKLSAQQIRTLLAAGDSAAAYAEFQNGCKIYPSWKNQPTLLSGMLQITVRKLLAEVVGEGLRDRVWAEPELRKLEADLAATHIGADYRESYAGERDFFNARCDELVASSPLKRAQIYGGAAGIALIPQAFFRDNQLRYNQQIDELLTRVSADGKRFDPDVPCPLSAAHLTGLIDPYYFFLAQQSARSLSWHIDYFIAQQTQFDEARLAIALERFRLAHGGYPDTLAELLPAFIAELPVETYSRQPLIYRRKEGGTFLLYGVGQDRTDDGGVFDPTKSATEQRDDIWPYAPPPFPAAP